jgi:protein O-GlcNAc transferase
MARAHPGPGRRPSPPRQAPKAQDGRLQQALAWHQQGQLAPARALYEQLLGEQPTHADAWHLLGVLLLQTQQAPQALAHIDRALALQPGHAAAHANRGMALMALQHAKDAVLSYQRSLQLRPGHVETLVNLGIAQQAIKDHEAAVRSYAQALLLQPTHVKAACNQGVSLAAMGRLAEAIACYDRLLAQDPQQAQILCNRALAHCQLGQHARALADCARVLELEPQHVMALRQKAHALQGLGQPEEALRACELALSLEPDDAATLHQRGVLQQALGQLDAAFDSYARALAQKPAHVEAMNNQGTVLAEQKRWHEAIQRYQQAIALQPGFVEALQNMANALRECQQPLEALRCLDRALQIQADNAALHTSRGVVLRILGRNDEAFESHARALALDPQMAQAHYNLGILQREQGRSRQALLCFDQAIALDPTHALAHAQRGNTLQDLRRMEEARQSLARAWALQPDTEYLQGLALSARMHVCDWEGFPEAQAALGAAVAAGRAVTPPFAFLAVLDDPALQLQAAQTLVAHKHPPDAQLGPLTVRVRGPKIRLGYFSADFHDHATAYLMAELFELHDRERFELFAFSFGPRVEDGMRQRLRAAFDHFIEVNHLTDAQVAQQSRALGIDIAIDLKGFTKDGRTGIFACRAAPIQVNYLGYPGSMGAPYIDYIVADPVVIPPAMGTHYDEKIAYLPDSYQVNDRHRQVAQLTPTRAALGLPEKALVFCCFNNNFKITPETFAVWMQLLHEVPDSVLWLLQDNPSARERLQAAARGHGLDPERLVFASRAPLPEHLARHRQADLFLDTWPYNAHTTASDALWAGLPVLTFMGQSFASRVAASLLHALDLPELVCADVPSYRRRAIELARQPKARQDLREKLARQRVQGALFDTPRLTRHLETLYAQMVARWEAGLAPDHLRVDDHS